MKTLSGGHAVVRCLESEGVEMVFGQPGSHTLEIYDALRETPSIKHVNVKHEANAAFMADVYGRLTGKPGVCLTTAGPGATNCVTAMAQAYAARSPVVHICGHCETTSPLPFHGLYDHEFLVDVFRPVTKRSYLVNRTSAIEDIISEAFDLSKTGKMGPVHIEVPRDVLEAESHFKGYPRKTHPSFDIDSQAISEVIGILNRSKAPIILGGQGVIRHFASKELIRLAEQLSSPVMTPWNGRCAIPFDHPLAFGYTVSGSIGHFIHPLFMEIIKDSDTVLAIGSELGEAPFGFLKEHKSIIIIDCWDEEKPNANMKVSSMVKGEIRETLSALCSELQSFKPGEKARQRAHDTLRSKRCVQKAAEDFITKEFQPNHLGVVIAELGKAIGDRAVIASDTGVIDSWMYSHFPYKGENILITAGRYGSMGFALPAAIAAKFCFPERPAVAICGDGSFLMSMADFGTAVEHHLEVVFIILNDRKFGSIGKMQELQYRGRYFGIDIHTPDFAKFAASFGASGFHVENASDIRKVFGKACSVGGPAVISVACDSQVPLFSTEAFDGSMA